MTDQIDGKAVERGIEWLRNIDMHDEASAVTALLSERDALQAQVEALHRERTSMIATHRDSIKRLTAKRDAALAREGAVAMEVRARDLSCAMQVFSDAGCGCDDAENIAKAIRALPIPTDAAAALARREDEVIERVAMYMDYHGIGQVQDRDRIRALKRSGKETK